MTYERELLDTLDTIAHAAIGGSPWSDDVEQSLSALKQTIRSAIARDATLRDIFGKAAPVETLHGSFADFSDAEDDWEVVRDGKLMI